MNRTQRSQALVLAGALALCVGLWAPAALAQQNSSVITGTVADASTQQPISDVVITATSAALQGEEVAVTDATGLYRLPQLPPGVYTLRFEKEGFQPYSRTEITLRLNRTIRLNAQLLPDEFQTTMEISGTPPAIDVGSTRTGVSVDTDLVRNIAVVRPGSKGSAARSFESLAELAPGANADAYGISLNGTTSPENGFLIDGLAAGNPSTGVLGSPISVEFIQEVNVITGGFMPEFGRSTGGVVTAVTKSGSNEFHGSLFTNITPGFLEHSPTPIAREGSVITTSQRLWNLGDFGADLGGPIIKDKLWFYVGVAPSFTRRQLERNLNLFVLDENGNRVLDENGFSRTQRIPGTTTHYFADQRSVQYIGKLTWQAAADHTLTLSVYGSPTTSGGNGRFAYRVDDNAVEVENIAGAYSAYAHRNEQDSRDISLKLASSFLDKRVLLDATVGWHHQVDSNLAADGRPIGSTEGFTGLPQFEMQRTRLPGSPRTNYYSINDFETLPDPSVCEPAGTVGAVRCPVTNYLLGGPGLLLDRTVERYQANVVATGLFTALGHHVFKAGFDTELMTNEDIRGYSGSVLYRENVNGQTFQDFRAFGYLTGPDEVVIQPSVNPSTRALAIGGFVQDSWSVMDKVTLNAGVRYDSQTVYGTGGNVAFELPNQISPRVGLIYDFTQQGRSKLYASFARYYQNAVLAMVNSQFSNITRIVATRNRAPQRNAQGDIIAPGCDPLTQAAPYTECRDEGNVATTAPAEQLSRKYTQTFAINSPVDPDLEPQSSDEWVVGADYEILPRATLGISYTHRNMNAVIEDMSRNEATNYFIGNPGRGIAAEFPKPVRNYDAVTLSFNKAFSDLWLLQASYTWSRLWGNYSGLFRPENLQLAPNVTSDFDLISLTENKLGLLLLDRTHSVKIYGAKELPLTGSLSLNLGLSYRGTSGAPINITGAHYIYGPDFTFILPRGAGGRLPFVHNIDTRLSASYRLSGDMVASVSMDVFNLFNFQAYTAVDQRYTADTVDAIVNGTKEDLESLMPRGVTERTVVVNPNFGKPTAYQSPRSIRLGARLSF